MASCEVEVLNEQHSNLILDLFVSLVIAVLPLKELPLVDQVVFEGQTLL